MQDAGRLTISDAPGELIVVSGEIDAHTAPQLAERLAELPAGSGDIALDVSGVEFIDSSGLRVLIDVHHRAADADRRLVLRNPSTVVTRLMEIAGLSDHLHLEA